MVLAQLPTTDVRSDSLWLARSPLHTPLQGRTRRAQLLDHTPPSGDVLPLAGQPLAFGCRVPDVATWHHAAPSTRDLERLTSDSHARASLWDIRLRRISTALGRVGLTLPSIPPTVIDGTPVLNKDLLTVLSNYVRRIPVSLPRFVELMRGQPPHDFRLNKNMLPDVLRTACRGYQYLDALLAIPDSGVRAPVSEGMLHQHVYPANHNSAADRYPVLIKNLRNEQDLWRCVILDLDIFGIWPEVQISPFGVLHKGDVDPLTSGRVIHDLSFPDGASINDARSATSIYAPVFEPCDAIAVEIMRQ
ncbi:hypothetical protein PF010_g2026 [Phytophthora fragariae]|nr:hypothetical protein PF003_g8537 [Phytophthora fragariae]KAE8946050.1 hypothetical protein PF009_g4304 [Phytophthora fragariae]KAE9135586.1 hypothetical protein PF010_g2026 [Phytophthora fragariae]KAE9135932.1 hypothetical protein PF007_g2388 [Phytophthora fragariae]KAE9251096.1 hypothetical protein PF002_g4444 [Phytophthora fragariae]